MTMAAPKAVGAIWITQISFVKDHLMIIHVRYTCNLNLDYIKLFLAVSQNLEKLFTHLPTHVYSEEPKHERNVTLVVIYIAYVTMT
jgi:hypothetical protein